MSLYEKKNEYVLDQFKRISYFVFKFVCFVKHMNMEYSKTTTTSTTTTTTTTTTTPTTPKPQVVGVGSVSHIFTQIVRHISGQLPVVKRMALNQRQYFFKGK